MTFDIKVFWPTKHTRKNVDTKLCFKGHLETDQKAQLITFTSVSSQSGRVRQHDDGEGGRGARPAAGLAALGQVLGQGRIV